MEPLLSSTSKFRHEIRTKTIQKLLDTTNSFAGNLLCERNKLNVTALQHAAKPLYDLATGCHKIAFDFSIALKLLLERSHGRRFRALSKVPLFGPRAANRIMMSIPSEVLQQMTQDFNACKTTMDNNKDFMDLQKVCWYCMELIRNYVT